MKPRKTYTELYNEYAPISLCSTKIIGGTKNPKFVHIRFSGPVSNIPSLKNQKIKDTNILRPEAKVIFDLMTRSFQRSCHHQVPQFDVEIFCLVVCAYRKVSFDEDNVLTSVRDWLEPSHIRQGCRGWGVSVIPNDRMVSAYAVKKNKQSIDPHITEIYLRPLVDIRKERDRFLSSVMREEL